MVSQWNVDAIGSSKIFFPTQNLERAYSKAPIICTGFRASLAVHSYVLPNWHTYCMYNRNFRVVAKSHSFSHSYSTRNIGISECDKTLDYYGRNFESHAAAAEKLSTLLIPFMINRDYKVNTIKFLQEYLIPKKTSTEF